MIKRIKKLINEVYSTTVITKYMSTDVYKNPTRKDLIDIKKNRIANPTYPFFNVRFFVDLKNENVYVWDADASLHQIVIDGLGYSPDDYDYLAGGIIEILKSGRVVVTWDSMTFRNSSRDITKAGLLLNYYIKHEYKIPVTSENRVTEQDDLKGYVLGQVGKGVGNIAGTLATTVARASGIPLLAGLSDIIGKQVDQRISGIFEPLIRKNMGLKSKVDRNQFFYKDDYTEYQSGKYGYDLDLKVDKITAGEMQEIKKNIYPAFSKFGYSVKFIGKRTEDNVYTFILFPSGSRIPLRDNKRNPIVYALPIEVFQKIFDYESSLVAVYDLMKMYSIELRNL